MERIVLEKAPRIAVYTPDNVNPWDDAVTLALTYADIPYDKLWDAEVLQGRLSEYDWLHLHHEDFTGQYSKFYISYAGFAVAPGSDATPTRRWRSGSATRQRARTEEVGGGGDAAYVAQGGFLFAMCTATETIELALAALGVDIAARSVTARPSTRRDVEACSGTARSRSAMRSSR
jgi:hypothetical protein